MQTLVLDEILQWARGTDLVEAAYRRGALGFDFRLEGAPAPAEVPFPAPALVAVPSPAVGLFRFGAPGAPRKAVEGASVAAGELLGRIETGGPKPVAVTAPSAGRLLKVMAEDGGPAEYGQPLFLIVP